MTKYLEWQVKPQGEGESHMKRSGILLILLRDVNKKFWSHLGVHFFSYHSIFEGALEEIIIIENTLFNYRAL